MQQPGSVVLILKCWGSSHSLLWVSHYQYHIVVPHKPFHMVCKNLFAKETRCKLWKQTATCPKVLLRETLVFLIKGPFRKKKRLMEPFVLNVELNINLLASSL